MRKVDLARNAVMNEVLKNDIASLALDAFVGTFLDQLSFLKLFTLLKGNFAP